MRADQEKQDCIKFEQNQKLKHKKLKSQYDHMNELFTDFKEQRREEEERLKDRKKDNKEHMLQVK